MAKKPSGLRAVGPEIEQRNTEATDGVFGVWQNDRHDLFLMVPSIDACAEWRIWVNQPLLWGSLNRSPIYIVNPFGEGSAYPGVDFNSRSPDGYCCDPSESMLYRLGPTPSLEIYFQCTFTAFSPMKTNRRSMRLISQLLQQTQPR